jgi:hypothetical protein
MTERRPTFGWSSDFPGFTAAHPKTIQAQLKAFVADASVEQVRAWAASIPPLQEEVEEILFRDALARNFSAILEYQLPLEARRPDVVFLVGSGVVVIELKGKLEPSQADIDQAAAYARDLRCYHRECAEREVTPVLVPTRAHGYQRQEIGVHIVGPDALDELVASVTQERLKAPIDREQFLHEDAYRPLPTLVKAARELLLSGTVRRIHRAHAATAPAVDTIKSIVHKAAGTKTRHLILVTGVPGAGKTLVGLQTVHAHYLDDLAIARPDGKPTAPAVFLSGNGPLVQVLQYELKAAGGGGKTFVRDVKNYVKAYSSSRKKVPPEHVLVYDEAQRAFDAAMVAVTHRRDTTVKHHKSEPELFIEFADRVPEWCVVVGLIGTGQEIHVGEEAGIGHWLKAVEGSPRWREWRIHTSPSVADTFKSATITTHRVEALSLDVELRQHTARHLHRVVAGILEPESPAILRPLIRQLELDGFHFRLTRDLDTAKRYLRERYAENADARFGLMASSKDKSLPTFGVSNDYQSTRHVKIGPWYGDGDGSPLSCRGLTICVTEFGAQGLELDATLLAWGTDWVLESGSWSNARASRYLRRKLVRDARQLRRNAYRVLLTRARDASVVFVPQVALLDETFDYLKQCGFTELVAIQS